MARRLSPVFVLRLLMVLLIATFTSRDQVARGQQLVPQNLNPQITNRNFPTVMLNGGGDGSALPPPPPGFTLVPTFAGPFLVPVSQERRHPLPSPSSATVRPSREPSPPPVQSEFAAVSSSSSSPPPPPQNLFQSPVSVASNGVNFRNGDGLHISFAPNNDGRPAADHNVFHPFLSSLEPEFTAHNQAAPQPTPTSSGEQGQHPVVAPSVTFRPQTNEHLSVVFQTPRSPSHEHRPELNFGPQQNGFTPIFDGDRRSPLFLPPEGGQRSSERPPPPPHQNFAGQESMPNQHHQVSDISTTTMLTVVDFMPTNGVPTSRYVIGLGPSIADTGHWSSSVEETSTIPTTSTYPPPETAPTHFLLEMGGGGQQLGSGDGDLREQTNHPTSTETSVIFPQQDFQLVDSTQTSRFPQDVDLFLPMPVQSDTRQPSPAAVGFGGGQGQDHDHHFGVTNAPPSNSNEDSILWTPAEVQTSHEELVPFLHQVNNNNPDNHNNHPNNNNNPRNNNNNNPSNNNNPYNNNHNINNFPNNNNNFHNNQNSPNNNNNLHNNNIHNSNHNHNNLHNNHNPNNNNNNNQNVINQNNDSNNNKNLHQESTISTPPQQSIIMSTSSQEAENFPTFAQDSREMSTSSGEHELPTLSVTLPTTFPIGSGEEQQFDMLTTTTTSITQKPPSEVSEALKKKQEEEARLELMQSPGFVAILNGLQQRNRASTSDTETTFAAAAAAESTTTTATTPIATTMTPPLRTSTRRKIKILRPTRPRTTGRRSSIIRTLSAAKSRKPTTTTTTTTEAPTTDLPTTEDERLPVVSTSTPRLLEVTATASSPQSLQDDNQFPSLSLRAPEVGSDAVTCDPSRCRLPHCFCGGNTLIPGGLKPSEVPQTVLLTFDDSVNEINYPFYSSVLNDGRMNPNGCPISATFYVSHEWTDYGKIQTLYAQGHEIASHSITHSDGAPFSEERWLKEIYGQKRILSALGGVPTDDVRGMRAPFLQGGGNKQFSMLHASNFTYDSSIPSHVNSPPTWPYTLDYRMPHECGIPPCPNKSYPGVWEVPMVMWEDLKHGHCAMADACQNPTDARGVYDMLVKNFKRHYTSNRAPFGMFYHYAWFTHDHHREGFLAFIEAIMQLPDVYMVTNSQLIEWMRRPTPISRIDDFEPWQCAASTRAAARRPTCSRPSKCSYRFRGDERQFPTCQPCPDKYPWLETYEALQIIR